MPLTGDAYANTIAKPYFSGLLPDESARSRLASALGISDTNAFGMLEIIGGECMAMRIGGTNLPDTIQRNHWLSLAPDTKAAQQLLIKELSALAINIIPAMEKLLSECKNLGIEHPVLGQIAKDHQISVANDSADSVMMAGKQTRFSAKRPARLTDCLSTTWRILRRPQEKSPVSE